MKNLKHYSFVFSNNYDGTVATMTLATPTKIDALELGDDIAMSLMRQLGINVNTQVTVDTIDQTSVADDPCKDCTSRTCEWSACSYSNE